MSSPIGRLIGLPDDSREVELINSLVEKTRQGKIPWIKQTGALTARIPSGFEINFVLSMITIFTKHPNWELLTVRDRSGNELVRVNNVSGFAALSGGVKGPLVEAADELFKLVDDASGDDLERAINAIKNL
jgi:hypothetical protein